MGIPYAAICMVDNLANGVGETELSVEDFEAGKALNRERLMPAVEAVCGELEAIGATGR
jgi:hypothetical protein